MNAAKALMTALIGSVAAAPPALLAETQVPGVQRVRVQMPAESGGWIYGSQLMTQRERDEYRARLHAAASFEERGRIRDEHYALMQARARERGLSLPDLPPPRGSSGRAGPERIEAAQPPAQMSASVRQPMP